MPKKYGDVTFYGVHVNVFTYQKSIQYVFTQKKLNLQQRRWFKLLKDYDVIVLYHPGKANMVAYTLIRMTMDNVSHVEENNK